MKRFVSLLLLIAAAVIITTIAHDNPAKVTIFLTEHRIDFSLNFAIVVFIVLFFGFYFGVSALRASGQLPAKLRQYWKERKQTALLKANTDGVIALITGDESGADRALKNAAKTGLETDLTYLIRAMSALQSDDLDLAESILNREKASNGQNRDAVWLLKARVALAKGTYAQAQDMLDKMSPDALRLIQVKKVRMLALTGLGEWKAALEQYRLIADSRHSSNSECHEALGKIYQGLCKQAQGKPLDIDNLVATAKPAELKNIQVLRSLAQLLASAGMGQAALQILEPHLLTNFRTDLLEIYHPVAVQAAREALPFVERLLELNPEENGLLELAADVCEQEQLWGKAIARFEKLYSKVPSAHIAARLEKLYQRANQPEKARQWQGKLNQHLVVSRQPA